MAWSALLFDCFVAGFVHTSSQVFSGIKREFCKMLIGKPLTKKKVFIIIASVFFRIYEKDEAE